MGTWISFEPDEHQRVVMSIAFAQFEATAEWPFLQFVRRHAVNAGIPTVDEVLRGLPVSYFYPRRHPLNQGDEVRLTVPALAQLDQAEREVILFIRVLRMFGSRLGTFEPAPREVQVLEVTSDDVRVEVPEVTTLQLKKLFSVLQTEPLGSGSWHGPDGPMNWRVSMAPEEAERLGEVSSIDEYLKTRHRFPDELPPAISPITIGSTVRVDDPSRRPRDAGDSGSTKATFDAPRVFVSWAHSDAPSEAKTLGSSPNFGLSGLTQTWTYITYTTRVWTGLGGALSPSIAPTSS